MSFLTPDFIGFLVASLIEVITVGLIYKRTGNIIKKPYTADKDLDELISYHEKAAEKLKNAKEGK